MSTLELSKAILAGGLLVAGTSCSQVDTLCSLMCDCEHCNDWTEEAQCESLSLDQEMADIYDCGSAWDTWAECVENKGQCREESSTFTTLELDYCASFIDLGQPCTVSSECNAADAICNMGSCMRRSCNSAPTQPCTTDADCPTGPDQCEQERQLLDDCEQGAAAVVLGTNWSGGGVAPPPVD